MATGSSRDAIPTVWTRLYLMGQGRERRNEVTNGNEEVGQTDTRQEVKTAGTSTEDAVRKNSQATLIMPTDRKT
jgi:hypothetical protein